MFSPLIPNSTTISVMPPQQNPPPPPKKKRNLPGNPDPDAEVIALSPKTLMATNRFVCEICNKGFQRDQNLQLHRRGHNLPWKLKQKSSTKERKKAYVCPEPSCLHHHPSRALGDLTGIKKHYCRKHGEKKWRCNKCSKIYAVQSDWKAHSKTCGTREYRCDCGTIFSRKDSFITHRAFCEALAEESARLSAATNSILTVDHPFLQFSGNHLRFPEPLNLSPQSQINLAIPYNNIMGSSFHVAAPGLSSTTLFHKGVATTGPVSRTDGFTRDFLGLAGHQSTLCDVDLKNHGFGFNESNWPTNPPAFF